MTELIEKRPTNYRRRALLIVPVALLIVYLLWNIPALEFIVVPLRLFVTYVHEAGHSLMAMLTGGRVIQFVVSPNGSGLATTAGGTRALILPAGYLGAAFFGAALFYLANRFPQWVRQMAFVLGAAMLTFTILFARPDEGGAATAILVGGLMGLALMAMAWKANPLVNLLVLDVLAAMTALNAVLDVWLLVRYADSASRGIVTNDAAAFSRDIMPILPPAVIAFIWAGIAILMMGVAIWYTIIRPLRQELDTAFDSLQKRQGKS